MGKQKEESEETKAVDSDYSGRPLRGITIEELRASAARVGIIEDDVLVRIDADGNEWDAATGEKSRPPCP